MRLIDADALDEAFTALRFAEDGTLGHWGDRKDWCLQGRDVEKLIANAPTVNRWISAERYPDQAGQRYLMTVRNDISGNVRVIIGFTGYGDFAWYTDEADYMEDRYTGNNRLNSNYTVTHWMTLPEGQEGNG